eukprot:SAG25_NODE_8683_length_409_cov_0.841935_1_plen_59_part_01
MKKVISLWLLYNIYIYLYIMGIPPMWEGCIRLVFVELALPVGPFPSSIFRDKNRREGCW